MSSNNKNYKVSAREYRPDCFDTVVGQDSITTTLKNSIRTKTMSQAYLFCGPRGVGKTTCARIFAKTINCFNPNENGEACNKCESCVDFNEQRSMNIFELDAASKNSVENIKGIIEQTQIPPQIGKYSVYIIDEVHMLSSSAFNAFLKTLEEPPSYVVFILATTEKYKILPTILSRCQTYDFNRISINDIIGRLKFVAEKENIFTETDALHVIAQKADGGMRDALSTFDQMASFTNRNITYEDTIKNLNVIDYEKYFEITKAFLNGDYPNALLIFNDILKNGFEANYFVNGLASHYRDILVCKEQGTIDLLEVGDKAKESYMMFAKNCSITFLFQAIEFLTNCDLNYKQSQNKRLLVELVMLKLCNLQIPIFDVNTKPVAATNINVVNKESQKIEQKPIENKPVPVEKNIKADANLIKIKLPKTVVENSTVETKIFSHELFLSEWGKYWSTNDLDSSGKLNAYIKSKTIKRIGIIKYALEEANEKVKTKFEQLYLKNVVNYFRQKFGDDSFDFIFCNIDEYQEFIEPKEEKTTVETKVILEAEKENNNTEEEKTAAEITEQLEGDKTLELLEKPKNPSIIQEISKNNSELGNYLVENFSYEESSR